MFRTDRAVYPRRMSHIKAETVLAELNRLRQDLDADPSDPEWFALHHAFCFVSYRMGDFQAYLDETVKAGQHPTR